MSNRKACHEVETVKLQESSRRQQLVQVATKKDENEGLRLGCHRVKLCVS